MEGVRPRLGYAFWSTFIFFIIVLISNINGYLLVRAESAEFAKAMLRQLKVVGQRHAKDVGEYKDAESLRVRIYAEALGNLIVKKEWHNLFPDETIMGRNKQ